MAEKKVFCKDCTVRLKPVKFGVIEKFKGEEAPEAQYEEFADGYRCLECAREYKTKKKAEVKARKEEFIGNEGR